MVLPLAYPHCQCCTSRLLAPLLPGSKLQHVTHLRALMTNVCCAAAAQACYGIEAVPEGEWLCWPCTDYEASLRKQGQSQATIRPPRWVHTCL